MEITPQNPEGLGYEGYKSLAKNQAIQIGDSKELTLKNSEQFTTESIKNTGKIFFSYSKPGSLPKNLSIKIGKKTPLYEKIQELTKKHPGSTSSPSIKALVLKHIEKLIKAHEIGGEGLVKVVAKFDTVHKQCTSVFSRGEDIGSKFVVKKRNIEKQLSYLSTDEKVEKIIAKTLNHDAIYRAKKEIQALEKRAFAVGIKDLDVTQAIDSDLNELKKSYREEVVDKFKGKISQTINQLIEKKTTIPKKEDQNIPRTSMNTKNDTESPATISLEEHVVENNSDTVIDQSPPETYVNPFDDLSDYITAKYPEFPIKDYLSISQFEEKGLPCHFAVQQNDMVLLKKLVDAEADIDRVNSSGNTPLHDICLKTSPNWDVIHSMVSLGSDLNKPNSEGKTPLHLIFENSSPPNIEQMLSLLDKANDCSISDENQRNYLHIIAESNSADQWTPIVEHLVKKGAELDLQDDLGRSPLYIAVNKEKSPIIQKFISLGADPQKKSEPIRKRGDFPKMSPLELALSKFNEKERAANALPDFKHLRIKAEEFKTDILTPLSNVEEQAPDNAEKNQILFKSIEESTNSLVDLFNNSFQDISHKDIEDNFQKVEDYRSLFQERGKLLQRITDELFDFQELKYDPPEAQKLADTLSNLNFNVFVIEEFEDNPPVLSKKFDPEESEEQISTPPIGDSQLEQIDTTNLLIEVDNGIQEINDFLSSNIEDSESVSLMADQIEKNLSQLLAKIQSNLSQLFKNHFKSENKQFATPSCVSAWTDPLAFSTFGELNSLRVKLQNLKDPIQNKAKNLKLEKRELPNQLDEMWTTTFEELGDRLSNIVKQSTNKELDPSSLTKQIYKLNQDFQNIKREVEQTPKKIFEESQLNALLIKANEKIEICGKQILSLSAPQLENLQRKYQFLMNNAFSIVQAMENDMTSKLPYDQKKDTALVQQLMQIQESIQSDKIFHDEASQPHLKSTNDYILNVEKYFNNTLLQTHLKYRNYGPKSNADLNSQISPDVPAAPQEIAQNAPQSLDETLLSSYNIAPSEPLQEQNKVLVNGGEVLVKKADVQLSDEYASKTLQSLLKKMHPNCGAAPSALKIAGRHHNLEQVETEYNQLKQWNKEIDDYASARIKQFIENEQQFVPIAGQKPLKEELQDLDDQKDAIGKKLSEPLRNKLKSLSEDKLQDPSVFYEIALEYESQCSGGELKFYACFQRLTDKKNQLEKDAKEERYRSNYRERIPNMKENYHGFVQDIRNKALEYFPDEHNISTLEKDRELWENKSQLSILIQSGAAAGHYVSALINFDEKSIKVLNSCQPEIGKTPEQQKQYDETIEQEKQHYERQIKKDILPFLLKEKTKEEREEFKVSYETGFRQCSANGCGETSIYNALAMLKNDTSYRSQTANETNKQIPKSTALALRQAVHTEGINNFGEFYYDLL